MVGNGAEQQETADKPEPRRLRMRDAVYGILERAQADQHPDPVYRQMVSSTENAQMTALARCLPKSFVANLLSSAIQDTLPIRANAGRPLTYGGESTVFDITELSGKPLVLKLIQSKYSSEAVLEDYQKNQRLFQQFFGDLVVPTAPFIYESRFNKGRSQVAVVQTKVEGECLFAADVTADPTDFARLSEGTELMRKNCGMVPDFGGDRNVLVDAAGRIRIIDLGLLIPEGLIERSYGLEERLELLASAPTVNSPPAEVAIS